ncbi:MAG: DUF4383 domain-containing protein [bacterium]
MEASSPARLYCALVGAGLVIAGIIGFFYSASFDTGNSLSSDEALGLLALNGWHNLLHLAIGVTLLIGANSAAREFALGIGLLYLVLAVWGFVVTDNGHGDLLNLVPINTEDNFLHLILGLTGVAAGAATPKAAGRKAPAT